MLVSEISQSNIPVLHYDDVIADAIKLLQQNDVEHLPVLNDEVYEGLLSLDELSNAEDADSVNTLKDKLTHTSVFSDQHILTALKVITTADVSVLPVLTTNNEYIGSITHNALNTALFTFLNCEAPGGLFVLEIEKQNFSVGELCRLVETNDAFVTQLNTYTEPVSGLLIVTFKINKTEISDVLATLQRYDYSVRHFFGEELYENDLRENFDNLMSYLNV